MFEETFIARAASLLELCRARKIRIATVESCTGGLVSALLTEIPGSTDVFERGFVTYSNEAKTEMLGVRSDLIAAHGAVSVDVATAMAQGAITHSHADIAISVTGIAGPGGGSSHKPVGTVCFGQATADFHHADRILFPSTDRTEIRTLALDHALALLLELITEKTTD